MPQSLKTRLTALYHGPSHKAVRFRYGVLAFDLVSIAYFILTTPLPPTAATHLTEALLALVIGLDFAARLWVSQERWRHMSRIWVLADLVVILALLLQPVTAVDLSFLRILRGLRIGHSPELLRDLRRDSAFFRLRDDTVIAIVNLVVFLFLTTSAVFAGFVGHAHGYAGYVDSLYFTVATLTTTGYGDITPTYPLSKLATVGIMIIGVSLFVQLVRAVLLPAKVKAPCRHCGLVRHDPDAVHCKHCGAVIYIETDG